MNEYLIPLIFFGIALFYSSVGFGGGSSYLALLSLVLTDFHEIRTLALILNIGVVTIGTLIFMKNRVFDFKQFWPFLVFSIPLAFFGAQLKLSQTAFFLILGGSLILAAISMVVQSFSQKNRDRRFGVSNRIAIGGGIGFLSGVAGIGGGIFLSPILNLSGWANSRTVASLASAFILSNSIAGLGGLIVADLFILNITWASKLLLAVAIGGIIGSSISNTRMNVNMIKRITAILVAYIGCRLVLLHGFGLEI